MPQSGATICVNVPLVVSETLNGESIIMHHGTGHYFDTSGSGALMWQEIESGTSLDGLVATLVAAYALDEDAARGVAGRFVQTLARHDLVVLDGEVGNPTSIAGEVKTFAEPELGVHEDLADMLLLDPIHDVDEAGWPAPREIRAAE